MLAAVVAIGEQLVHDSSPDPLRAAAVPFAPLIGVARLARRAFLNEDMAPWGTALLARAQAHPTDANALLDCSTVLQLTGDHDIALSLQAEAIKTRALYSLPAQQTGRGLRLLAIMGPGDLMANTPIEFLVEDSDVSLDLLFLTLASEWPESVPEHDVMLVALGESEANRPMLHRLAGVVDRWSPAVINLPERIAVLSRDGVCAALRTAPGVDMPTTVRTDRAVLRAIGEGRTPLATLLPGDDFPLIVRPIGSHAGQGLEKSRAPATSPTISGALMPSDFYVSPFVDYRGADGVFRKYRIALIEGRPFVCHYAMSTHWMIAYFNAGMAESADKRAEEADCMAHFDEQFAVRHAAALRAIDQRMGLPYVAIDCAENRAGDLLIFEVDNAMVVHAMDPEDMFPYKKPAMRKVFVAFRQMLEHARQTPAAASSRPIGAGGNRSTIAGNRDRRPRDLAQHRAGALVQFAHPDTPFQHASICRTLCSTASRRTKPLQRRVKPYLCSADGVQLTRSWRWGVTVAVERSTAALAFHHFVADGDHPRAECARQDAVQAQNLANAVGVGGPRRWCRRQQHASFLQPSGGCQQIAAGGRGRLLLRNLQDLLERAHRLGARLLGWRSWPRPWCWRRPATRTARRPGTEDWLSATSMAVNWAWSDVLPLRKQLILVGDLRGEAGQARGGIGVLGGENAGRTPGLLT